MPDMPENKLFTAVNKTDNTISEKSYYESDWFKILLSQRLKDTPYANSIHVTAASSTPTGLYDFLRENLTEEDHIKPDKLNIIPYDTGGKHFVLVALDLRSEDPKVIYLNPKNNPASDDLINVFKAWYTTQNNYKGSTDTPNTPSNSLIPETNAIPKNFFNDISVYQQYDNYNCGLWLIENATAIAKCDPQKLNNIEELKLVLPGPTKSNDFIRQRLQDVETLKDKFPVQAAYPFQAADSLKAIGKMETEVKDIEEQVNKKRNQIEASNPNYKENLRDGFKCSDLEMDLISKKLPTLDSNDFDNYAKKLQLQEIEKFLDAHAEVLKNPSWARRDTPKEEEIPTRSFNPIPGNSSGDGG